MLFKYVLGEDEFQSGLLVSITTFCGKYILCFIPARRTEDWLQEKNLTLAEENW